MLLNSARYRKGWALRAQLLLNSVRYHKGVGSEGSAHPCLCGHLVAKATSYLLVAVFGSTVVYVLWFLTNALGKGKTNSLAMTGRVFSY